MTKYSARHIGMRVYDIKSNKEGMIADYIFSNVNNPISVLFDDGSSRIYTEEGKYWSGDKTASLFLSETKDLWESIDKEINDQIKQSRQVKKDHSGHRIIMNQANGEVFRMCKDCCEEIKE